MTEPSSYSHDLKLRKSPFFSFTPTQDAHEVHHTPNPAAMEEKIDYFQIEEKNDFFQMHMPKMETKPMMHNDENKAVDHNGGPYGRRVEIQVDVNVRPHGKMDELPTVRNNNNNLSSFKGKSDALQNLGYQMGINYNQDDNISEKGGIANIVDTLNKKKNKRAGNDQSQASTSILVAGRKKRPDSPPLKEIFIPTNHEFKFSLEQNPVWKSQLKPRQRQKSTRLSKKVENDTRIQNILRRGRERFFSRRGRKKKVGATE